VGGLVSHSVGLTKWFLSSVVVFIMLWTLDLVAHRGIRSWPQRYPSLTYISCVPCYSSLGIDYVGYALGQTDTFQGTGVFSGIKMQRESSPLTKVSSSMDGNGALPPLSQEAVTAAGAVTSSSTEAVHVKEPPSTV
jgi:hypothetical protein